MSKKIQEKKSICTLEGDQPQNVQKMSQKNQIHLYTSGRSIPKFPKNDQKNQIHLYTRGQSTPKFPKKIQKNQIHPYRRGRLTSKCQKNKK